MNAPRRKEHRLPRDRYLGQRTVAFTTCILDRTPIFVVDRPTLRFGKILEKETERHHCDLILACFMPDHLHALVRGRQDHSDSLAAFERFKLRSAILMDRFHRPAKWQKNLYDHIVRCDEDWRGQAKYNALNPVRKDLVEDVLDYPFFFSSLGSKDEILTQIFWDG